MLSPAPNTRIFVAIEPFDMRGAQRSLAGAVRRLGLDPTDGHLYVFLAKRRNIAKILFFDRSGWVVYMKRLERGTFQLPLTTGASQVRVDATTLHQLLDGVDLSAPRRRWYRADPASR